MVSLVIIQDLHYKTWIYFSTLQFLWKTTSFGKQLLSTIRQKYFAVEKYFDVEPFTLSVERGGGVLSTVSSFSQLFCYISFPPQLTKISDRHFLIPEKISVQLHTVNF